MNKSKAIGTAAESAVVKVLQAGGFGGAERRALHGNTDLGDVLVCPGLILEVKGGKAAEGCTQSLLDGWLAETEAEKKNAGAELAFLVTKRKGYGVGRAQHWWAHVTVADLVDLTVGHPMPLWSIGDDQMQLHIELRHLIRLLRRYGYGDTIARKGGLGDG